MIPTEVHGCDRNGMTSKKHPDGDMTFLKLMEPAREFGNVNAKTEIPLIGEKNMTLRTLSGIAGAFALVLAFATGFGGQAMAQDHTGLWVGTVEGVSEGTTKISTRAGVRGTRIIVRDRDGVAGFNETVTVRIDRNVCNGGLVPSQNN